MTMSVFLPPSLFDFIPRHMAFSTWVEHLPFGYDLVAELQPSILVELGAYSGLSFFCFCQSLVEHEIDGKCYAIDTWEGDDHTGQYGEQIYEQVIGHGEECYPELAQFIRTTFAEAVTHFNDASIDLLHIDGLHTYEAVKQDFETWYGKVKPGGIILFHDVCAREPEFGVWKYWQEISQQFDTFEFKHGFGLGVLRKPSTAHVDGALVRLMFAGSRQQQTDLRSLYCYAAHHVMLRRWSKKRQEKSANAKRVPMATRSVA